jgi:hypothetical protein
VGRSGGQSPIDTKQNARSPGFTRSWRKSSSMTMIDAALLLPRVVAVPAFVEDAEPRAP